MTLPLTRQPRTAGGKLSGCSLSWLQEKRKQKPLASSHSDRRSLETTTRNDGARENLTMIITLSFFGPVEFVAIATIDTAENPKGNTKRRRWQNAKAAGARENTYQARTHAGWSMAVR